MINGLRADDELPLFTVAATVSNVSISDRSENTLRHVRGELVAKKL